MMCERCAFFPGEYAAKAALHGHLECLKAAHAAGCPSWHYATPEAACMVGNVDCLKWALTHGAAAGFFTARAALHFKRWDCLEYAITHGCPVHDADDLLRPMFVGAWVSGIMTSVKRTHAARTIQAAYREAYYNPGFAMCRKRVRRQFHDLGQPQPR
ncbi:MAG: hypothetical protein EOO40_10780 [Deltaproteobacteria bacterium]|nr:MAG: hypothetical protein EOO40_10780 [Deltaproteobacteria bacterium]